MAGAKEAVCDKEPDFFRAMLIGLTIDCPQGKTMDECVMRADQSLPFDDRVDWIESLSDEKILDLYSVHHACFKS